METFPGSRESEMAYPGVIEDVRRCIKLQVPSRVPVFPLSISYDYHYFGYTHAQWRNNPEVMIDVGIKAIEEFDYDIYMLHPDDLIEYEEIGIKVKFDDNIPPAVYEYLPTNEATLNILKIPSNLTEKGRMASYLQGLLGLKECFGESVCLAGRIAAPFSAVSLILGIESTLMLMLENPLLLKKYMEFFVEYNDLVAKAQLKAGADAIWLGDCVATSHFISPEQYEDHAAEYADMSARRIRDSGGIVFYHGNEKSISHLKIMAGLSFDAINIGEGVDIGDVKKIIGKKKCIMGNLDTIHDLQPKQPEEIETIIKEIIMKAKPGGGYIFCTGEGIPPNTPFCNIKAMMRAAKKYGKY
jgi:uroporphyrinogen decarboxylase